MEGSIKCSFKNAHKSLIHMAIFGVQILDVVASRNLEKDHKLMNLDIKNLEREAHRLIHPHVNDLLVTL